MLLYTESSGYKRFIKPRAKLETGHVVHVKNDTSSLI